MVKSLSLILTWLMAFGVWAAEKDSSAMLQAYANMNFAEAKKLADAKTPEGQLIEALCLLNDKESQNIPAGLKALEKILQKKELSPALQIQGELTYARMGQLTRMRRNIYGDIGDKIDSNAVYDRIITKFPKSTDACYAAVYKYEELIDSKDQAQSEQGLSGLEKFIQNFPGNRKMLSGPHLLANYGYIYVKNDYNKSVPHLIAAYECGIANPAAEQTLLFSIGRLADLKLHDSKTARKYYQEFIRRFPASSQRMLAEKYLKELK